MTKDKLPRWEKVLQRTFPPLALTTSGSFEFNGFHIGAMNWIREREMLIKYQDVQMYMIQDPAAYYISNIKDLLDKKYPNFEKEIDKINADVYKGARVLPGKNLKDLQKLIKLHSYMYGVMLVGFDVVIDIGAKINEVIKNQSVNFQEYLENPIDKTGVQREKEAILKAKNNLTGKKLHQLAVDFGYIHQDYLGQPWNIEDYRRACRDNITLKSVKLGPYNIKKHSSYEQYLIRIFKKFIYMYEEGRNAMVRVCWAMKAAAQALGYDPEKMLYMTETELKLFATGQGAYISDRLFNARQEAFAIYFEAGKYYEFTGNKEVKKLIKNQKIEHFWKEKKNKETILKGAVAYQGKVRGKVRLVFTQAEANQVKKGEILVSPMTQVEFLSGIRKCGAIVTDEGGIICHAAIVAREFGKPCILATKNATKTFKNGDWVEVDANQGIVKLMS